jgi:hypothetical protein
MVSDNDLYSCLLCRIAIAEKLISFSPNVSYSQLSMESGLSIPCSQNPTTSNPKPDESSPQHLIPFLHDTF